MTLKAIFIYKPVWRILQMWVESPYIIITPTVIIIITRRTTVFISAKMKHTMRRYDFSLNWRLSFITYFDGILISINITIFSPSIFPWNDTCEKKIESTNMKKFSYINTKKDKTDNRQKLLKRLIRLKCQERSKSCSARGHIAWKWSKAYF